MMIVESVLSGTYYGWAQMMLVSLKQQRSLCKRQLNHDCANGTVLPKPSYLISSSLSDTTLVTNS